MGQKAIDFLIIGSAKCGTTSLHNYLNQHPDIYLASGVGVNSESSLFLEDSDQSVKGFSNKDIRKNLNNQQLLEEIFNNYSGQKLVGEESTDYSKRPYRTVEFERIIKRSPGAKIVMIIRHPVKRIVSHFLHYKSRRPESVANSIKKELEQDSLLLDISRYHYQLKPYIENFGVENIKILKLEDLVANPKKTLSKLFVFLGVNPQISIDTDVVFNKGQSNSSSVSLPKAQLDLLRDDQQKLVTLGLVDKAYTI